MFIGATRVWLPNDAPKPKIRSLMMTVPTAIRTPRSVATDWIDYVVKPYSKDTQEVGICATAISEIRPAAH